MSLFKSREERQAARRVRQEQREAQQAAEQLLERERLERFMEHEQLLTTAAGIASLDLVCHRDTWLWIYRWCIIWEKTKAKAQDSIRSAAPDDPNVLTVALSGPVLVNIMSRLYWHQKSEDQERRIFGTRFYAAFVAVVSQVDPAAAPGTAVPPVVIDAKAVPAATDEPHAS
ncbi:hypothetical protein [Actinomadura oligospora]|uniref:hypothetical protein n=1 Tax=Actinomadura oligospora TaxID=111804 RepID=UPI00047BA345|nr:hypothetical protein [Actinomadura oligospora]